MRFAMRAAAAALLLVLVACRGRSGLPEPGSSQYRDLVHAFNIGLSALQVSEDVRAKTDLTLASTIAPAEPAIWADLGLLAARQQEFNAALQNMEKARALAPQNSGIEFYLGDIESKRGHLAEAIGHFRKAVELDRNNLKALYSLAEEIERQSSPSSDSEALTLLKSLLALRPNNAAVLLDVARLAAKTGDSAALKSSVDTLAQQSAAWPDNVRGQMNDLETAAHANNPRGAALRVAFLRNVLLSVPDYRRSADAVKTPAASAGAPLVKFLRLPMPDSEAAEPDWKTTFQMQPLDRAPQAKVAWMRAIRLDDSGRQSLLWSDGASLHIDKNVTIKTGSLVPNSVAVADLNFDFRNDLVVAGPNGVRLWQQQPNGDFADITGHSSLPAEVVNGAYTGAWPFDFDLDGDLDIVLGVRGAPPLILRNNGNGTFAQVRSLGGPVSLVSFALADVAGSGAPDIAMVGQDGSLTVLMNDLQGRFHARAVPASLAQGVQTVTSGDFDGDGLLDFIFGKSDGSIVRLSDKDDGGKWDSAELAKTDAGGNTYLEAADFDNNGTLDLLAGKQVFLNNGHNLSRLNNVPALISPSVMDVNNDGRLDLVGISEAGAAVSLANRGAKNYGWQNIRLRAANVYGDQRINSFGLGGEIEIRADMLTEKQAAAPVVHFGLGNHTVTDVARILWPNGLLQVEFDLKADTSVLAAQRLKGSCPSLFAWDGKQMSFVKDSAPLATDLGLPIASTTEWYKLPGEAVAPRHGYYDLRITDELWESYYIDSYNLLVVDHPRNTEIYVDESYPAPKNLKIYTTAEPSAFRKVTDDLGNDVSATVRSDDRNYLDTFGRGRYQGVTRDHWVEMELPADAPAAGPLYLLADGWMHPTDASIDVAMKQAGGHPEQGLRIEVQNTAGQWVVARSDLGFPASKRKTMVFDLSGLFLPNAPRKLRVATNMEIFWDRLAWAPGLPNTVLKTQQVPITGAELQHRGFSVMTAANASSPEEPDYNHLEGTMPKWLGIEGFYTRYGDVRELLDKVDDRYVIMGSGDEVRLRFAAPAAPPAGWVRDFIMIGDGWIKDGDYNSAFSRTLAPLPWHGMTNYLTPPGNLEDEKAYRLHPQDWQRFHTRYVGREDYRISLWK